MVQSGGQKVTTCVPGGRAGGYLVPALLASLCLHVGLVALPAGQWAPQAKGAWRAPAAPAPLHIRLAPWGLRPALGRPLPRARPTVAALPQAPHLVDAASGEGGVAANGEVRDRGGAAQAVTAGLPAPQYFEAEQLSRLPEPLDELDESSGLAAVAGDGVVVLVVFVNTLGGVDRVESEANALTPGLQEALHAAFLGLRFRPAEREGEAVNSRLRLEVLVRPLMRP